MKRTWTDKQLIEAVKNSFSISGVLQKLNLIPAGGSYKAIKNSIRRLGLNTSHFTGQGHLKGKTHNWNKLTPLKDILTKDSAFGSYHLKERLMKDNLLKYECQECGINSWHGRKLFLHLDHINGINNDNRLENLRLLCPNCHSLTDTYCGKNKGKKKNSAAEGT